MPPRPRQALAGAALLGLVAGGLFFQDLGRYPLWDPDEARHAEVAREMAAAHGWRRLLLPTFELQSYREKPPGHYWLVSLAYAALGVGAGAARTPSAAAAWLLVMALYAWTQAPSLVFYLRSPVVHTDDPRLVRDLFGANAPAFVVTGRRHVAEIEALLGPRGHLWYATPRRRLYGNQPPPG